MSTATAQELMAKIEAELDVASVEAAAECSPLDWHDARRVVRDAAAALEASESDPRGMPQTCYAEPTAEPIAAVRALHKPVPTDEGCDSETWSTDHYGQAVDPYWIRCGLRGRHSEHGDPGNTGCTWPLTDADRTAQQNLPASCDECQVAYPCPTVQILDGVSA